MGTTTKQKQKQIQNTLDALGWSHHRFADVLYEGLNDNDDFKVTDKENVRKLGQNIKKQLKRNSTPEERLNKYLQILFEHPDYQALNLGNILPRYIDHNCISEGLADQLALLSSELDFFDEDKKDR